MFNNVGQTGVNNAFNAAPSAASNSQQKPEKYITTNGIMGINPAYRQYQANQGKPADTGLNHQPEALNVICNMDEHMSHNAALVQTGQPPRELTPSTNGAVQIMQDPDNATAIGLDTDEAVDRLGNLFAHYEVPMGMMNKLMGLDDRYQGFEFIMDDSGSMTLDSDTKDKNGRIQSRWNEAKGRLLEMIEVLAHVPCPPIQIRFLNSDQRINLRHQQGMPPERFLQEAQMKIANEFPASPRGGTPVLRTLSKSFNEAPGLNVARYLFCDGQPSGGDPEMTQIENLVKNRSNPKGNPITFLSCTNEDEEVEWMKELEEVAEFAAEYDDYDDEKREVLGDQGRAVPYSKGFHLIGQIVGAMNPDDLDALDESVPFTKFTIDNIMGVKTSQEEYVHYFQEFEKAQSLKQVKTPMDQVKKRASWGQHFHTFANAPGHASGLREVQSFKAELARVGGTAQPQAQVQYGQPNQYAQGQVQYGQAQYGQPSNSGQYGQYNTAQYSNGPTPTGYPQGAGYPQQGNGASSGGMSSFSRFFGRKS